jgi:hypothetical protein
MTPSAKVFFEEVRAVYAETAATLGLSGPAETEQVLPASTYKDGGVAYEVVLDFGEGAVECQVRLRTDSVTLTVDIEPLAIAVGVVEKRGGISYSARNLKQMRKSLQGQADYVQRVHRFLTDADAAEELIRQAGAREWSQDGTP